uniref:Uncharacterized protein n=1 Tax=Anguilla anguilla TaxID=7936 RepID=A0A0E9S3Z8_ANGAN
MLTVLLELRSKDTIQGHCWSGVFFFVGVFSFLLSSV